MNSDSEPRIIGRVRFTDGTDRDVYEDAEGRQYVRGNDGASVYGIWLPLADEPITVPSPRGQRAP
jgi:hypothetical protein